MNSKHKIMCERCGEVLNPKRAKWLELSNTDGNFYIEIPKSHVSQGCFAFGTACAFNQLDYQTKLKGEKNERTNKQNKANSNQ